MMHLIAPTLFRCAAHMSIAMLVAAAPDAAPIAENYFKLRQSVYYLIQDCTTRAYRNKPRYAHKYQNAQTESRLQGSDNICTSGNDLQCARKVMTQDSASTRGSSLASNQLGRVDLHIMVSYTMVSCPYNRSHYHRCSDLVSFRISWAIMRPRQPIS